MTVISARAFRANQSKYLEMAACGESVILTSRKGQFKITPVSEEDREMIKAEFLNKINDARQSLAKGEGVMVSGKEELINLLESL